MPRYEILVTVAERYALVVDAPSAEVARAERVRGRAEALRVRSTALYGAARDAVAGIEPGQPILVGHLSLDRETGLVMASFNGGPTRPATHVDAERWGFDLDAVTARLSQVSR